MALDSITAGLKDRERRRADLLARLERLDGRAGTPRLDSPALQARLKAELENWQAALKDEVVKARRIIRKLVKDRLTFQPDPETETYTIQRRGLVRPSVGDARTRPVVPPGETNQAHIDLEGDVLAA